MYGTALELMPRKAKRVQNPLRLDPSLPAPARQKCLEVNQKRPVWGVMGHSQGRDNVRKRAARRKKTERIAGAKAAKKKATK